MGWIFYGCQNEYYTAMIGAKPLGINGASLLWMASSTNVIGYEKTDGNPGNLVAKMMMKSSVPAPCENPLDLGRSAFDLLAGCVTNALNIPAMSDKSSKVCARFIAAPFSSAFISMEHGQNSSLFAETLEATRSFGSDEK